MSNIYDAIFLVKLVTVFSLKISHDITEKAAKHFSLPLLALS